MTGNDREKDRKAAWQFCGLLRKNSPSASREKEMRKGTEGKAQMIQPDTQSECPAVVPIFSS